MDITGYAIRPNDGAIARATVFGSVDGGKSWAESSLPEGFRRQPHFRAEEGKSAYTEHHLYFGDDENRWTRSEIPPVCQSDGVGTAGTLISDVYSREGILVATLTSGCILNSSDSGRTWEIVARFRSDAQEYLWRARFVPAKAGCAVTNRSLVCTQDAGGSWVAVSVGDVKDIDVSSAGTHVLKSDGLYQVTLGGFGR